jgi:hypothetical protein
MDYLNKPIERLRKALGIKPHPEVPSPPVSTNHPGPVQGPIQDPNPTNSHSPTA